MPDLPTLSNDLIQQLRGIFYAKDRSVILGRSNFLGIPLIGTPTVNPNGGWYHVYLKNDGCLYGLDSAGNEFLLASNLPGDTCKVSQLYQSDFGGVALSADATGYLSANVQPLFSAYNSVSDSNVTGDGTFYTVIFDTEIFDRNANYNNGTGVFTAPVTGKYLLVSAILITAGVAHTTGLIRCSTSNRLYASNYINPYGALSGIGFITLQFIAIVDMDATDTATIDIYVSGGAKTTGVYGAAAPYTYFQGYMLI